MDQNVEANILKEKLEQDDFSWTDLPSVLLANTDKVRVNKWAPDVRLVQQALELKDLDSELIQSDKLSIESSGDWEFHVLSIDSDCFESRGQVDSFFCAHDIRQLTEDKAKLYGFVELISIKTVFDVISVQVTANLDHYLKNQLFDELEKDVAKKVDRAKLESETYLKELRADLFYNLMCQLFGSDQSHDDINHDGSAEFMLRDFHLLSHDGNARYATAKRGSRYLLFWFITS